MRTPVQEKRLLSVSAAIYRRLLRLYPADFRQDFDQPMRQVFRDLCRDAYRQTGAWGLAQCWATALFDLLQNVIIERRKAGFIMTQDRFIQWSGWLCILGGVFFAASSLSQLGVFSQPFRLSLAALIPGMALITLGMLGIFLRFRAHINLFGRLALQAAFGGAAVVAIGWLLTLTVSTSFWSVFIVGWLFYLGGHSTFGGFAATTHLLPKWNFALLIGSALPLTVVVLGFSQRDPTGMSLGGFVMLLLIGIGWILTGWALNSHPAAPDPMLNGA